MSWYRIYRALEEKQHDERQEAQRAQTHEKNNMVAYSTGATNAHLMHRDQREMDMRGAPARGGQVASDPFHGLISYEASGPMEFIAPR